MDECAFGAEQLLRGVRVGYPATSPTLDTDFRPNYFGY